LGHITQPVSHVICTGAMTLGWASVPGMTPEGGRLGAQVPKSRNGRKALMWAVQTRISSGLAPRCRADSRDEFMDRGILEEVAAGSRQDCILYLAVLV
jgi:hypothetical protein